MTGKRIGYVRVSTVEQNTDRQLDGMSFDRVFTDKASGSSRKRPALEEMLRYVREDDQVFVHSIDRLARSMQDLQNLVEELRQKKVSISFVKEGLEFSADSDDPFSRLTFNILGSFAEFERAIIRARQAEGIAKAKARGVYRGRKKEVDREEVRRLSEEGLSVRKSADKLGVAPATVQRIREELGLVEKRKPSE